MGPKMRSLYCDVFINLSPLKVLNFNPFSAGTAFMLMQTGWIQASPE